MVKLFKFITVANLSKKKILSQNEDLRSLFCHGLSEAQSSKVFFFQITNNFILVGEYFIDIYLLQSDVIILFLHPVGLLQGTEVVANNSRSHTCLLSGVFIGNVKVLVRLQFGIDGPKEVAMKLAVRSEDDNVSDMIHEIVASG